MLLDEAVGIYRKGGAQVAEDGQTVHIGRDMVEAALATAPKSITMRGGARHRDIELALGNLVFQPGAAHLTLMTENVVAGRAALKISVSWCRSLIILMPFT